MKKVVRLMMMAQEPDSFTVNPEPPSWLPRRVPAHVPLLRVVSLTFVEPPRKRSVFQLPCNMLNSAASDKVRTPFFFFFFCFSTDKTSLLWSGEGSDHHMLQHKSPCQSLFRKHPLRSRALSVRAAGEGGCRARERPGWGCCFIRLWQLRLT